MALIEGLEAGEGEHASNWGDSAEQSRQARLQQLEALQSLEAMSTSMISIPRGWNDLLDISC